MFFPLIFEFIPSAYTEFVSIMVIGLILAIIVYFVFKLSIVNILNITGKRMQKIANSYVPKPVFVLMILASLSYALKSLKFTEQYTEIINNSFFIIAILITAHVAGTFANEVIIDWLKSKKRIKRPPKIISKIMSATIYLIAGLVILIRFNIEITPIIATLGVGGIAIGLALQGTLSNFFAGLNVLSDKPIRIGDFIQIEGGTTGEITGHVEDIGWRSTRIKTLLDTIIIIPNAKIAESIITNYHMPTEDVFIYVECGVAYESDLEHVEKVVIEVVDFAKKNIPGVMKEEEPSFRLREFADSNITFRIYFKVEEYVQQFRIKTAFMKELKKRFDKEKIEISWPIMKIYQRK